jgi:hypothetical protein
MPCPCNSTHRIARPCYHVSRATNDLGRTSRSKSKTDCAPLLRLHALLHVRVISLNLVPLSVSRGSLHLSPLQKRKRRWRSSRQMKTTLNLQAVPNIESAAHIIYRPASHLVFAASALNRAQSSHSVPHLDDHRFR